MMRSGPGATRVGRRLAVIAAVAVVLDWEAAYARAFKIQTSANARQ